MAVESKASLSRLFLRHWQVFSEKVYVFINQKTHSRVKASNLFIEGQRVKPSQLTYLSVFIEPKGFSFLLRQQQLKNSIAISELLETGHRTLNFRLIEPFEQLRNGDLGDWGSKESKAFIGMRSFDHFRELIDLMGSIDVSIHLFVSDGSDDFIASRMVVPQGLSVIDVVGKRYVGFVLVELSY
jgi:hypothetical protein